MFRRLHEPSRTVEIMVDGQAVTAAAGDTVATVLLVLGTTRFRQTVRSQAPRSVYCGMGVCFDCLVTIDGEPNRQACLAPVADGMVVTTGAGAPHPATDMPQ